MSLYSDLTEVLTPYANKINELNGSLGDVKADLSYLTESEIIQTEYRQGYLTTNGAFNTSDSGESYIVDISGCSDPIHVYLEGNNNLRYGLYTAEKGNVDASSAADVYKTFARPFPNRLTLTPSVYSDYKTLILTTGYNNPNTTHIALFETAATKADLKNEIDTVNANLRGNIITGLTIVRGTINTNGSDDPSSARIRTNDYVQPFARLLTSSDANGRFFVYAWENGVYKGGLSANNAFVVGHSLEQTKVNFEMLNALYPTYDYRFVYLIIDGTATLTNISDLTLTSVLYPSNTVTPEKIRVMFNNLGGFNFGNKTTKMTTAEALQKIENYKQFYAEYQPNLLCLEEYPMDTSQTSRYIDASETVDPSEVLYPYIYPYETAPYQYSAIKSDFEIVSEKGLSIRLDGFYYGLRGDFAEIKTPENRIIGVISTVFDVNGTTANRTAQMQKCIELLGNYEYALICVDTNMLSQSEYDSMKSLFARENYQISNGGFYPLTNTCPAAVYKQIDNIFVKGKAKIKSFIVPNVLDTLASDHLPVVSDIIFY